MATSTEEDPKRKSQPKVVKLNKALKLAEQWVNNMSKSSVDEKLTSVDLEGRPSRLGIGATVPKESRVTVSDNPIERKLLASLNATRKKAITNDVDLAKDRNNVDEESEEEESESKTRFFGKKRPQRFSSPFRPKKKLG